MKRRSRCHLVHARASGQPLALTEAQGRSPLGSGQHVATLGQATMQALAPALARGLGFDLRAAVAARRARLVALHTMDSRPLPSDWAIPILSAEVVVVCAPLASPWSGVAALIVHESVLPTPTVDDAMRERVAQALAEALLAEIESIP